MEPKTENTEEQEKTDLELTDEEMDQVAGGYTQGGIPPIVQEVP